MFIAVKNGEKINTYVAATNSLFIDCLAEKMLKQVKKEMLKNISENERIFIKDWAYSIEAFKFGNDVLVKSKLFIEK